MTAHDNMSENQDVSHLGFDVSRIEIEGSRVDRVRNIRRVLARVATDSMNGCSVEGHRVQPPTFTPDPRSALLPAIAVTPVPCVIEVYADRVEHILRMVRTPEQIEAKERAQRIADRRIAEWTEAHAKVLGHLTEAERARKIHVSQNEHWTLHFEDCGGPRSGMPPLVSCEVIHATDGTALDARAWLALPREEATAFTIDPPPTQASQAERAADAMATVLAKTMQQMQAMNEAKASKK